MSKHEAVIGQGVEMREKLLTELKHAEDVIDKKAEEMKQLIDRCVCICMHMCVCMSGLNVDFAI